MISQTEANRLMWYQRAMAAEAVVEELSKMDLSAPYDPNELIVIQSRGAQSLKKARELSKEYLKQYPD